MQNFIQSLTTKLHSLHNNLPCSVNETSDRNFRNFLDVKKKVSDNFRLPFVSLYQPHLVGIIGAKKSKSNQMRNKERTIKNQMSKNG